MSPFGVVFPIRNGLEFLKCGESRGRKCNDRLGHLVHHQGLMKEEEDQEHLLRLGGDLRGGDRLGDLVLGDCRPRLGDLTLMERLGDLDLERRGLLPLLLRGGEGKSRIWIGFFFACSSSAIHQFCSSANNICRLTVQSRRLICDSVELSSISSGH